MYWPTPRLLPIAQRQQHAQAAVEAGHVVAQGGRAGRHRHALGHPGKVGEPPHGVGDPREAGAVLVRAGLTVAGHPQHDEPRVDFVQHLPADPPLLQRPGAEVLAQDVRTSDQLLEQLGALGAVQVDGDRLLVPRLAHPGEGVPATGGGAEVAEGVAPQRVLNLDHLGAKLAQDPGRVRPGDHGRNINHADAVQRQFVFGGGGSRHGEVLDDSMFVQLVNLFGAHPQQFSQDLFGAVAQPGAQVGDPPGRFREGWQDARDHDFADPFGLNFRQVSARLKMLVREDVGDAVYLADGHLLVEAPLDDDFSVQRNDPLLHQFVDEVAGR